MKKTIVILFPQKEYLLSSQKDVSLFNDCIKQRYLDNDYELVVVKYKGSDLGIITLEPKKIIDANITFKQSLKEGSEDWQYADFKKLASILCEEEYSRIIIGGFHCFDCVEKFANEVYKINPNTIVDKDLTEVFWSVSKYQDNWDIKNYNAQQNFENILYADRFAPPDFMRRLLKKYENPIWGIKSEYLEKIKEKIKVDIIEK